jgi:acetyltransferase-like isoleucine patch superfamily enzyme
LGGGTNMSLALKIKRQENGFYAWLYRVGKHIRRANCPSIDWLHRPLYSFDCLVRNVFCRLIQFFWSVPLFQSRCEEVGEGLSLPNGIPLVVGDHLRLILGENVTIGRTTIGSSKVGDSPVLRIGSNSSIGYGTTISVAREVSIGSDCMISINCLIMDSDDHPVSPALRLRKMAVAPEDVRPVRIGNNVWLGAHSAILKGVSIGDNTIVGAHSVVTRDLPANCICAGNPAKIIRRDIQKDDKPAGNDGKDMSP